MDKYETNDAVSFALDGKPIEFEKAIHQLLGGKLQDAILNKREEIAQSIYGDEEDPQEDDNSTVETPEETNEE